MSEHAPPAPVAPPAPGAPSTAESGRDMPPPMPERVRCAVEAWAGAAGAAGASAEEEGGGPRAERGGLGGEVRAERVHEPSCLMTRRVGEEAPSRAGSARDAVVYGRYADAEDCAVAWWRW